MSRLTPSSPVRNSRRPGRRNWPCGSCSRTVPILRAASCCRPFFLFQSGRCRQPEFVDCVQKAGVIWKHLMISLWESILAFAIGSIGRASTGRLPWFARAAPGGRDIRSLHQDGQRRCPRVVPGSDFSNAVARASASGRRWRLASRLVFSSCSSTSIRASRRSAPPVLDNGRMLGMNERQLTRHVYWPSALSWDVFLAAYLGLASPWSAPWSAEISRLGGRARLSDPAGRRACSTLPACSLACLCCSVFVIP